MRRRAMRRALYGWMFYTPPVLLVVGVLAFDAWLNIEMRRNDYEVAELKAHAIQLNDALERIRSASAATQQMHKLQERALEMGLREPQPWQIERVYMQTPIKSAEEFSLARVIPDPPTMPERAIRTLTPPPAPVQPSPQLVMADAGATDAPVPAMDDAALMLEGLTSQPGEHVAQLSLSPVEGQQDDPAEMPATTVEEVHSTRPVLDIPNDDAAMLDESPESMLAI